MCAIRHNRFVGRIPHNPQPAKDRKRTAYAVLLGSDPAFCHWSIVMSHSLEPIISVSGLRGIVGQSLTPLIAARYAAAFAAELPAGSVVITRDGRTSGAMLSTAISGALQAMGRKVIDAGIAATPTMGVLVREHQAAGGIQVSASHNPAEYNGLKLFAATGRVIPAAAGVAVLRRYQSGDLPWADFADVGSAQVCSDSVQGHWTLINRIVDVHLIQRRRLTVLLDANHGAGSILARRMLEELGCHVKILGGDPNGRFDHPPEPTEENLSGVLAAVVDMKAQVGFCQDPDADRLAVIDENGRYLGEEYTLAMCVDHALRRHKGPIVTNCSTSRMSEDLATKYGVPFHRSAVGEANVVDKMLEVDAVLGGEGNGGVIDPRVGLVRDSFVGMALLLEAMASRDRPISQLADELPRYSIVKTKIPLPSEKLATGLKSLSQHFTGATCDYMDGVRFDWPNKWLLVRASNTESIVRAIAEAPTAEEARRLCVDAANILATTV
jgi:phosphomannomutase